MNNAPEYRFKTDTGTCTLTSKALTLTDEAFAGRVSTFLWGNSVRRVQVVFSGAGIASLGVVVHRLLTKSDAPVIVLSVFTLWSFYTVFSYRGVSVTKMIERSEVVSVDVHRHSIFHPGYAVIHFVRDGKTWKRNVNMRATIWDRMGFGSWSEFDKGLTALRETGWYSG